MTLAEYNRASIRRLIDFTSREASKAERDSSAAAIHGFRVAIRRLSENLRVFEDLFPRDAAKRVRKELREAMKLAGATRTHDIAFELMEKAEVPVRPDIALRRMESAQSLAEVLRRWRNQRVQRGWREQLHV